MTSFRTRQPGDCCCGDPCAWAESDFSSITDWQETADRDDWSVSSDTLRTSWSPSYTGTGSGTGDQPGTSVILHVNDYNAQTRNGVTPPDGPCRHKVQAIFNVETAGRTFLLVAAAADSGNFIALEITVGTGVNETLGELRLVEVSGAVTVAISQTHVIRDVVAGRSYVASLDFWNGNVRASISTTQAILTAANDIDGQNPDTADPTNIYRDGESSHWIRELNNVSSPYDPGYSGLPPGATGTGTGTGDCSDLWHGPYVGVGAGEGSGEVRVTFFQAGCLDFRELCQLEDDRAFYKIAGAVDLNPPEDDNWTLSSGTFPGRGAPGAGYTFESIGRITHKNPVVNSAQNNHRVSTSYLFYVPIGGDIPEHSVKVLCACDEAGDNGLALGAEGWVDGTTNKVRFALFGLSSGVYTRLTTYRDITVTPPLFPQPFEAYAVGLSACYINGVLIATYSLFNPRTVYTNYGAGTAGFTASSSGNFCGIEVDALDATAAIDAVNLTRFDTARGGYVNSDNDLWRGKCQTCDPECPKCTTYDFPEEWLMEFPEFTWSDGTEHGGAVYAQVDYSKICYARGLGPLYGSGASSKQWFWDMEIYYDPYEQKFYVMARYGYLWYQPYVRIKNYFVGYKWRREIDAPVDCAGWNQYGIQRLGTGSPTAPVRITPI